MEDYWNEFQTVREKFHHIKNYSYEDEEYRSPDDESDDLFLESVLTKHLNEDREISETELINSRLFYTLTEKQKLQIVKRAQERNVTLRQKRLKVKTQKPDLWSIFSGTDNSSTGTRSRSATPDSLDSISPPRTPPDPSPKNWVDSSLSRSRASLDSGHHSLINSPSSPLSTSTFGVHLVHTQPHVDSVQPSKGEQRKEKQLLGKRFSASNVTPKYQYNGEKVSQDDNNETRIYRPSSLDVLSDRTENVDVSRPPKEASVRRQRSYAKELSKDLRYYYTHKGVYEVQSSPLRDDYDNSDIRGIRYRPIGSIHLVQPKVKDRKIPFHQSKNSQQENLQNNHRKVHRSSSIKLPQRDPFDLSHGKSTPNGTLTFSVVEDDIFSGKNLRKKSADLGFRFLPKNSDDIFADVAIEISRSGQTRIEWVHEEDAVKLASLALIELDILFSDNRIHHSWRKRGKKHKLKEVDNGVFGTSLELLHQKDLIHFNDAPLVESSAPQILQKLVSHLELKGVRDEGILRISGNRAKTDDIRRCLDENFYERIHEVDVALRGASANDIAALFKLFLRELPQPLLTHFLALAFYKTHRIPDLGERLLALNMLIILLPTVHRYTLKEILDLCSKIIAHEKSNKMGLYNVAMIIAPNIFLPSLQPKGKLYSRGDDKEQQLSSEMEYARVTTELMQIMIKYKEVLWNVPNRLIAQIRRQYDASPKSNSHKPLQRLLGRKSKDVIQRPINNEVEYQNGVMRITAPQFSKFHYPVRLSRQLTAMDILSKFIEDQALMNERPSRVYGRREQKQSIRGSISTPKNGQLSMQISSPSVYPEMTTCLLRRSLKHALGTHALYERGGNITEKRVDSNAYLIAVYQDNPNGEFLVKCLHPGGYVDYHLF